MGIAPSNPYRCMEPLTSRDVQQLLAAIAELYSLHDFNTFGEKALAIVHRLVGSEFPTFHKTHVPSRHVANTVLPGYPDPGSIQEVSRRNLAQHPLIERMPLTLDGAYKLSDFITLAELYQLEGLYQQFLRVIDCEDQMVLFFPISQPQSWNELVQADAHLVGLALNRSQPSFTDRDRLMLNLLRPHLFQAYTNAQKYRYMHQSLTHLHQAIDRLGLIILSSSGQVQLITASASQYLQSYFEKSTHFDRLPDLLDRWTSHQISLTRQALPQAGLPLRLERAGKQLVIRFMIEPHADRYLLLLEEHTLSLLDALKLLGLTARETEVLYWVIRGADNQAIAKQLEIHPSTVRKHLERVFDKLGVQSRTEAIALALDRLGIFTAAVSAG